MMRGSYKYFLKLFIYILIVIFLIIRYQLTSLIYLSEIELFIFLGIFVFFILYKLFISPIYLPSNVFLLSMFFYYFIVGLYVKYFNINLRFITNQNLYINKGFILAFISIFTFFIGYFITNPNFQDNRYKFWVDYHDKHYHTNPLYIPKIPYTICICIIIIFYFIGNDFISGGFYYALNSILRIVILYMIISSVIQNDHKTLVIAYIFMLFFIINILTAIGGSRSPIIIPAIQLFFLIMWVAPKKNYNIFKHRFLENIMVVLIIISIFIFTTVSKAKGKLFNISDILYMLKPKVLGKMLILHFDAFEKTIKILSEVPKNIKYLYGKSILESFYQFIPSFIWQNKPLGNIAADSWVMHTFYPQIIVNDFLQVRFPPSLIGEAYWNGGIIVVITTFVILGIFFGILERKQIKSSKDIIIFIIISTYSFYLVRGPFGNCIFRLVSDLFGLFVAIFLVRFFTNFEKIIFRRKN